MEKFSKIKEVIAAAEADVTSFYEKCNKAAGTRVRNAMQELKVLAQEIRNKVTEQKTRRNNDFITVFGKSNLCQVFFYMDYS